MCARTHPHTHETQQRTPKLAAHLLPAVWPQANIFKTYTQCTASLHSCEATKPLEPPRAPTHSSSRSGFELFTSSQSATAARAERPASLLPSAPDAASSLPLSCNATPLPTEAVAARSKPWASIDRALGVRVMDSPVGDRVMDRTLLARMRECALCVCVSDLDEPPAPVLRCTCRDDGVRRNGVCRGAPDRYLLRSRSPSALRADLGGALLLTRRNLRVSRIPNYMTYTRA